MGDGENSRRQADNLTADAAATSTVSSSTAVSHRGVQRMITVLSVCAETKQDAGIPDCDHLTANTCNV